MYLVNVCKYFDTKTKTYFMYVYRVKHIPNAGKYEYNYNKIAPCRPRMRNNKLLNILRQYE